MAGPSTPGPGWTLELGALFLDFGGTLAYREPEVWDILLDVCSLHGVSLHPADIDRGRAMADRTHRSEQFQTRERMESFWREWFRLILVNLGVRGASGLAEEIYRRVVDESKILLYSEVKGCLPEMADHDMVLGVVSNYNCMLEQSCSELGIADCFDFILASDLVRSHKPDRVIFDVAVKEAGVQRERCLHVGDSLGADYMGARNAGLSAILLDRLGKEKVDCAVARDLSGILDVVRGAGQASP